MSTSKIISAFVKNPKSLFLIDGLGALLSAFLIGIVLVQLQSFIGIPVDTLYILAIAPVFFAIYDFLIYLNRKKSFHHLLKLIAVFNLLYCFASIIAATFHLDTITIFGWSYIIIEIIIVLVLINIELKVATALQKGTN